MSDHHLEAIDRMVQEISAGVAMSKAWKVCSKELASAPVLRASVSQVVELSRSLGGSPKLALQRLVDVLRQEEEFRAELESEWATPRATMRLVVWLPIGFASLAELSGLPLLQGVSASLLGKIAVAFGALLLVWARLWSKRILRNAAPKTSAVADQIDLVALGLKAGLSFDKALNGIANSPQIVELLVHERLLSRSTGAPIAELVMNRAQSIRMHDQRTNRTRIKEAAVTLMWPLGVAVLPALILLLVVPLSLGFAQPINQ